jgi:hypothetical protein
MREIHFLVTKSKSLSTSSRRRRNSAAGMPTPLLSWIVTSLADTVVERFVSDQLLYLEVGLKSPVSPRTTFMSSIPRCSSQCRKLQLCEDVSWALCPRRSPAQAWRPCRATASSLHAANHTEKSQLTTSLCEGLEESEVCQFGGKNSRIFIFKFTWIFLTNIRRFSYTLPWRFQLFNKSNAQ